MKFVPSQLAYLTTDREARGNLRALARYLAFLAILVTVYAVLFHVIKLNVEHEQHSWVTGFYWTLVVMPTLGFGDITFTSDIGRVFSIVVLLSGVDILELSGATSVLPLKHQLGDYLANRVDAGRPETHVIGEFRGLQIAELPAHDTAFVGKRCAIRGSASRPGSA